MLAALDACGVAYTVNPRLVRGLDYYTRTTFEFTVPDGSGLGTQNALLGGGRYDGLSEMLGGPKAPGIGFAIGEDRLILTLQAQAKAAAEPKLDAFIAPMGVAQNAAALVLAKELRAAGLAIEVGDGSFRLKKSFEAADKLARRMVILGEDEIASGILTVKDFSAGEQTKVPRAESGGLSARLSFCSSANDKQLEGELNHVGFFREFTADAYVRPASRGAGRAAGGPDGLGESAARPWQPDLSRPARPDRDHAGRARQRACRAEAHAKAEARGRSTWSR